MYMLYYCIALHHLNFHDLTYWRAMAVFGNVGFRNAGKSCLLAALTRWAVPSQQFCSCRLAVANVVSPSATLLSGLADLHGHTSDGLSHFGSMHH